MFDNIKPTHANDKTEAVRMILAQFHVVPESVPTPPRTKRWSDYRDSELLQSERKANFGAAASTVCFTERKSNRKSPDVVLKYADELLPKFDNVTKLSSLRNLTATVLFYMEANKGESNYTVIRAKPFRIITQQNICIQNLYIFLIYTAKQMSVEHNQADAHFLINLNPAAKTKSLSSLKHKG